MGGFNTLNKIVENTNSALILFFVVVAIVILVLAIPLYKLISKAEKEKRELHFKRETMLMTVVQENSTVISKLTTLIENNNQNCHECKMEQTSKMDLVLSKQEEILNVVSNAAAVILDRKETVH